MIRLLAKSCYCKYQSMITINDICFGTIPMTELTNKSCANDLPIPFFSSCRSVQNFITSVRCTCISHRYKISAQFRLNWSYRNVSSGSSSLVEMGMKKKKGSFNLFLGFCRRKNFNSNFYELVNWISMVQRILRNSNFLFQGSSSKKLNFLNQQESLSFF